MILNFVFDQLKEKKLRFHFNEFMINFHNFIFENKGNEKKMELNILLEI
jgi:predicted ATPase